MKILFVLLGSLFLLSFCPSAEKVETASRPGFYIFVEDFTDRTNHEFLVESKDSVDKIFNQFFDSELELWKVDNPISIYNRKRSFYIARVTVFETAGGKMKFKNLKYPDVFVKRKKLNPAVF